VLGSSGAEQGTAVSVWVSLSFPLRAFLCPTYLQGFIAFVHSFVPSSSTRHKFLFSRSTRTKKTQGQHRKEKERASDVPCQEGGRKEGWKEAAGKREREKQKPKREMKCMSNKQSETWMLLKPALFD